MYIKVGANKRECKKGGIENAETDHLRLTDNFFITVRSLVKV